jgi:hypothetical protein
MVGSSGAVLAAALLELGRATHFNGKVGVFG